MNIQQQQNGNKGSFFIDLDNRQLAKMTYHIENGAVIVIEHTEVDPSLRGKNIGQQLINTAVAFAKDNAYKIKPECPYVRSVFERHPEVYKEIIFTK